MTEQVVERSGELHKAGRSCAESVLMAIAESRGVSCGWIPAIATGFCSGLCRTAGPCGALTGAVLAVGLALGRKTTPDESVEPCYRAVRRVRDGFLHAFESDNCEALTGCHLGTEEGSARFEVEGLRARCQEFVMTASRLALEAIEDASCGEPVADSR